MNSKRFLTTLPRGTAQRLKLLARQQHVDHSIIVQQAITKMSETHPTKDDIIYIRGETEGVQVSLSDTGYRLLELWRKQTGLSKSMLIAYSLQKVLGEEEHPEQEEMEDLEENEKEGTSI